MLLCLEVSQINGSVIDNNSKKKRGDKKMKNKYRDGQKTTGDKTGMDCIYSDRSPTDKGSL